MNVNSELQSAEREIRAILSDDLGSATTEMFQAYTQVSAQRKDAFVVCLIGRVVALEGIRRTRLSERRLGS